MIRNSTKTYVNLTEAIEDTTSYGLSIMEGAFPMQSDSPNTIFIRSLGGVYREFFKMSIEQRQIEIEVL